MQLSNESWLQHALVTWCKTCHSAKSEIVITCRELAALVHNDSTCWSRSNDLWVMSPTRFLCAKVLNCTARFAQTHIKHTYYHTSQYDTHMRARYRPTIRISDDAALRRYASLYVGSSSKRDPHRSQIRVDSVWQH